VEDRDAHIERVRKLCDLMDEFDSLIDPIRAQYPDLEHEKLIGFCTERTRSALMPLIASFSKWPVLLW
jgi:hypothetical protein